MLSKTANGRWFWALQKGIAFVTILGVCLAQAQEARGKHGSPQPKAQPCGVFVGTPKIKLPSKINATNLNRFPIISYSFGEDGKPFDVTVEKSTGVGKIDNRIMNQVKEWRFASHKGCGVIIALMKIVIDVRLGFE